MYYGLNFYGFYSIGTEESRLSQINIRIALLDLSTEKGEVLIKETSD